YLGILIENKLAFGDVMVLITSHRETEPLIENLKQANFGVTRLDAEGATGPVQVVSSVIKRKELDAVVAIIKAFDCKAFYSVNELQSAEQGVYPGNERNSWPGLPSPIRNVASRTSSRSIIKTVLPQSLATT